MKMAILDINSPKTKLIGKFGYVLINLVKTRSSDSLESDEDSTKESYLIRINLIKMPSTI